MAPGKASAAATAVESIRTVRTNTPLRFAPRQNRVDSTAMDGYYDYTPQVQLERHVLLAGFITEETRTLGYRMAALNGLPFADLDRKIEHRCGMSIRKLIWTDGVERYRALERECLEKELTARPFGVLTVGDGTLIDERSRALARAQATTIALELDLPNCYWRLQNRVGESQAWHPLYPDPLEHLDQIRGFYQLRRPGFDQLDHRVRLQGRRGSEVLNELIGILPAAAAP